MTGAVVPIVRTRTNRAEVAPQRLEREPLLIDLAHGAHPALAEERDGRTPALNGVLKQEGVTATGRARKRRSTKMPSSVPVRARVAALASSVRSMSHSASSS